MACSAASRAARDSLDLHGEPGLVLRKSGVGPGFRLRLRRFRPVARIERSEIRERRSGSVAAPGFRSAQPGLRNKFEGSGTPANAGSPTAASCDAARALLERARLTAFHHRSHLGEHFI